MQSVLALFSTYEMLSIMHRVSYMFLLQMDLSYKIVQTIENGQTYLSTVPSTWESNGNLKWPPKKFFAKALRNYLPPESDWTEFQCTLKQKDLSSDQATEMMKAMSRKSDTDETPVNVFASQRDRKSVCNNADSVRIDHNAQFLPVQAKVDISQSVSKPADVNTIASSASPPQGIIMQTQQAPLQRIEQINDFFVTTAGVNTIASSSTPPQGIMLRTIQTNPQQPQTIVPAPQHQLQQLNQHQLQQLQQQQQNQIVYTSMKPMAVSQQLQHPSPQFVYPPNNANDTMQASSFDLPNDSTQLTGYEEEEMNTESIDIQTLMGILSSIVESQSKIEVKMAEMVKIMNNNFANMFKLLAAERSQPDTPPVNLDAERFELIDSVEKLEGLEEKLKEAEYAKSMVSLFILF